MTRGEHETCRELLPWYVNKSLDEPELRGVHDHVERQRVVPVVAERLPGTGAP